MKITFANERLEKFISKRRLHQKELGAKSGKKLRARIMDILAAEVVGDLTAGHPHPLKYDRRGQFAIRLDGGHRLVFEADEPCPRTPQGDVDWANVTSITIVFVGDYHD